MVLQWHTMWVQLNTGQDRAVLEQGHKAAGFGEAQAACTLQLTWGGSAAAKRAAEAVVKTPPANCDRD